MSSLRMLAGALGDVGKRDVHDADAADKQGDGLEEISLACLSAGFDFIGDLPL